MTATTPAGLRARVRRLTSAVAVGALALGIGSIATPALAADGDGDDPDAAGVELSLSLGVHGRVAPGAGASATVTVANETDAEISAGDVVIELNRTPLAHDASVTTWLDDAEAPGTFSALGSERSAVLAAGEDERVALSVDPTALADLAPGIYPVRASLSGASAASGDEVDERATTTESVLVITPTTAQVGVIVPVTATPADGVLLSTDELSDLTAPDGALTAVLDGVTGTAAVLAVDPAIPAAIRSRGTAAPDSAIEWLTRLDELPNERFALQFGDADATVQSQAQLPALLQPATLSPFLAPQDFPSVRATETPDPAVTATPAPVDQAGAGLPDDAELTALDGSLDGILWPRAGVRAEDLATFETYLGAGTTTIVSSATTGGTSAAHGQAAEHELLVIDDTVSAAISDAADEPDDDARQQLLAAASARIYLAAAAAPDAPLLVGLERDESRDADALRDAISAVDTVGLDLTAIRATPAAAVTLAAAEVDTARVDALGQLLADEGSIAQFATVLDDPQVLIQRERIRLLRTIAVGVPAEEFERTVDARRDGTRSTLGAVSIPPSSTIQLLSAAADLPFSVRNDLPWPVTVRLAVASTDPRLDVATDIDVVVPANTSARVKVPVTARVGSGEVALRLSVYSPAGVLVDGPQIARVAVRAEWETIGLILFGSLAVLLIVGGVVRTVVRKRREHAETDADADADADADVDAEADADAESGVRND